MVSCKKTWLAYGIAVVSLAAIIALPEASLELLGQSGPPPGFGPGDKIELPNPTPSIDKKSDVAAWPAGRTPTAPAGFRVNAFAENLKNPRWLYVLPNGDVLVAESVQAIRNPSESFSRITLLRDSNKDGVAEIHEAFLTDVNLPFGMVLIGNRLFVGNTDSVMTFPYEAGQTKIRVPGTKLTDLPFGRGHYTRNLLANADNSKLYVAVGSSSNANENGAADREPLRATIWEMNPDGSGKRVFASGLRNPVGMDWEPQTRTLWAVVNERNTLGDDLVPDYFTSIREGAFYGWPYAYFGKHEDPTLKDRRPDLVAKAVTPDYAVGAHTAPLGLVFYRGASFPREYEGGAFIAQHGSVHRSRFAGFKVVFLAFRNGKPSGDVRDFLTGFIADEQTAEVYGRPVGLAVLPDGSLLIADDAGNKIWRVSYTGAPRVAAPR